MPNWHASTVGRYRSHCPPGGCLMEAAPGTSKTELDLFTQLQYVLGPGQRGYAVDGSQRLKADMAFHLGNNIDNDIDAVLVVEYDGAYWHQGREQNDLRKAETIGYHRHHYVTRIREDPLRPLRPDDVWVPKGTDALTCARLVLQHTAHRLFGGGYGLPVRSRIEQFLTAAATPLKRAQVRCRDCRRLARALQDVAPWLGLPSNRPTSPGHRR